MDNSTNNDVIEFVKEIAPEMDIEKVNIAEIILEQENIKEIIQRARERELSLEEQEATDFLETLLETMDMEQSEMFEEADISNIEELEMPSIGMRDIIVDDLQDTIENLPTGEFHNTDYNALLEEIRGCKANEYEAKCAEAEKIWSQKRGIKSKSMSMDRGR